MALVDAKCTNCGEKLLINDTEDAEICPHCNHAFVTEKAIQLYNTNSVQKNQTAKVKKRHVLKSLGKGLLMVLECVGYLIYVVCLLWLFFDITDDLKKK